MWRGFYVYETGTIIRKVSIDREKYF
jgi:hypothetical protein